MYAAWCSCRKMVACFGGIMGIGHWTLDMTDLEAALPKVEVRKPGKCGRQLPAVVCIASGTWHEWWIVNLVAKMRSCSSSEVDESSSCPSYE